MALYLGSNEVSAASGVPPVVTADDIKSALGYTPADEADIPTVPTALKNPQSLTFTGAATGSYDGSTAKTVNIPTVPTALKNPNALTFAGAVTGSYDGSAAKTVNIPTVPTALKNPNAIKIKLGSTEQSYDGSSAIDVEVTPSAIGALPFANGFISASGNIHCMNRWYFHDGLTVLKYYSLDDGSTIAALITFVPDVAEDYKRIYLVNGSTASNELVNLSVAEPQNDSDAATKQYVDAQKVQTASSFPASGTALTANTIYSPTTTAVTTYAFTPPTSNGWAHGIFSVGNSPNITFTGKILGKLPTFESGKQYEFDVFNGAWIVQEVVT